MTAEIAILNRSGIALASDSAVTIQTHRGGKVYNWANKLFMLSEHAPVGVMFFGGASLLGIPWDTLVKMFRVELGEARFPDIDAYARRFFRFLDDSCGSVIPSEVLEAAEARLVSLAFAEFKRRVLEALQQRLATQTTLTELQVKRTVTSVLNGISDEWQQRPFAEGCDEPMEKALRRTKRETVLSARREVLEKLPLSEQSEREVMKLGAMALARFRETRGTTGVVFAGFGEAEVFPSLEAYGIEGALSHGVRRMRLDELSATVDFENGATIVPLAQRAMADSFISGVDPEYQGMAEALISSALKGLPSVVAKGVKVKGLSVAQRKDLGSALEDAAEKMRESLVTELRDYRVDRHIEPTLATVAAMPKEEIAELAEALVNLTSVKKSTTPDDETVGGPIDVAVISKGDGFVWVRRKHYFDPALNPRFIARLYRTERSDE